MVFKLRSGGELWISGIPTQTTQRHFPEVNLQICCMRESPEQRGGVTLAGAKLVQFPVATARERASAWKELWPLFRNSLYQGDRILFHCMAGRHRAAVAGTVTTAVVGRMSLRAAEEAILARRPIKLREAFQDKQLADWAHKVVSSTTLAAPMPKAVAWAASEKSHVHILTDHEGIMTTLCHHKQGQSRPRELKDPVITRDKLEAIAWSLPFCSGCRNRAPASFLLD